MYRTRIFIVVLLLMAMALPATALKVVSKHPYTASIVVDPDTGQVICEENADAELYPASVIKLMTLLLVVERIETGEIKLDEMVTVTREAAVIGGSQVYLKENEKFTVDDLLYALMIKSANDVATCLAVHVSGSQAEFVKLMNRRAAELGMKSTEFHTPHGLPPSGKGKPDVSTPRDLVILAREVLKHPEVLKYTSARERPFRKGQFILKSHNYLLSQLPGCDGLKTGFFSAAGFSIAATAKRDDKRVLAIVMGARERKIRDAKAIELIEYGFANFPEPPKPPPKPAMPEEGKKPPRPIWNDVVPFLFLVTAITIAFIMLTGRHTNSSYRSKSKYWW